MKKWVAFWLLLCAAALPAQAQRTFSQPELDAMLAPVALHPDPVLSNILTATTQPADVAAAAAWSRANRNLPPDEATRLAQSEPWHPAVKALVAFPEVLERMDESPQWLHDLGEAVIGQQAQVMDTVQGLRQRAQASGQLQSTEQQRVYTQGQAIVIQPATQVVYVPYYDPFVVYGGWWWPHYHPVFWRPWAVRPVYVAPGFFHARVDWHRRHVFVPHAHRHVHTAPPGYRPPSHAAPAQRHANSPMAPARSYSPPPAQRAQPQAPQRTHQPQGQRPQAQMPQPVLRSTPGASRSAAGSQRSFASSALHGAPSMRGGGNGHGPSMRGGGQFRTR